MEWSEQERAQMRQVLEDLERQLERRVAELAESSRPVDLGESIGRLSRIDAIQDRELSAAGQHRLELRLAEVRAARAHPAGPQQR